MEVLRVDYFYRYLSYSDAGASTVPNAVSQLS